jgi:hypothetical protein
MAEKQAILQEYMRLRASGKDANTSLRELRAKITALDAASRKELVDQLRVLESSSIDSTATQVMPSQAVPSPAPKVPPIKPLMPLQTAQVPKVAAVAAPAEDTVTCPNCGKPNKATEVLCYACGSMLMSSHSPYSTRTFPEETRTSAKPEFFGADSLLVFTVKDTKQSCRVRPQEAGHEIIVGRSAGGPMSPDVDLSAHDAEGLGVSRMHLSLTYNDKQHTVSACDMSSANGSFLNGQRMHHNEVRVLRHGDELRLGRMILTVLFYHPTNT